MEILFRTKEESNDEQRKAFLKLMPAERFVKFLEMMDGFSIFPQKENHSSLPKKGNLVIKITAE